MNFQFSPEKIMKKFGAHYSVTPKLHKMGIHRVLGDHIAERFFGKQRVLDACVGGGFNALSLAHVVPEVIAVDIDAEHLRHACKNAMIEGVTNIHFIEGDIMRDEILAQVGTIDGAYLDPEWKEDCDGTEEHCTGHAHRLQDTIPAADELLQKIELKTNAIALRLPREFDLDSIDFTGVEIEAAYLNGKLKFYTIYFGDIVRNPGRTEYRCNF